MPTPDFSAPDASPPLSHTLISHRPRLVKTAARIVGCHSRAEDVVQDAYLRLCGAPCDALPGNARLGYLFRIVRNLAIDHYRRQVMEHKYFAGDDSELQAALQLATPESINADRQTLGQLEIALAKLPQRTRYAFIMYRVHGHQQKAIAAQLGVSPTLVNFMIRDAAVHCRRATGR